MDDPLGILAINRQRWQIEAAFRTLKSHFEARPVYLQRDERILSHFMTCFLAFLVFKIVETKTNAKLPDTEKLSDEKLLESLRRMSFYKVQNLGFMPAYTKNQATDALHAAFNLQTAYEFLPLDKMRTLIANSKGRIKRSR